MLAAAKAHMSARGEGFQERAVAKMALEMLFPESLQHWLTYGP